MRLRDISSVITGEGLSDVTTRTLKALYKMLTKKYGRPIGIGGRRVTFSSGRFVFKLPRNFEGLEDNLREAMMFSQAKDRPDDYYPLARCRLIEVENVPILVMEMVDPDIKNKPEWADWVDCRQVGRNRAGNVVAYDYAG